jgi:hypothetical protein
LPLTLAVRVNTPSGPMNIVLASYPASGLMSVELVPAKSKAQKQLVEDAVAMSLSIDTEKPVTLALGEFAAHCTDGSVRTALLQSGLFALSAKSGPAAEIWQLSGLAMLEFMSALAAPITASRASFPAHLFHNKPFTPAEKKALILEFDQNDCTRHPATGESIWIVREHCELSRIAFVIYFVKEKDRIVGACVCKAELAQKLQAEDATDHRSTEIVYESPRAAGSLVDPR